jgi:hypothetical protein
MGRKRKCKQILLQAKWSILKKKNMENLTPWNSLNSLTPQQSRYSSHMPAACWGIDTCNTYSGTLDLQESNKRSN